MPKEPPGHTELWVFIDESGDPSPNAREGDSRYFHVGMATLAQRPTDDLPREAMADLQADEGLCDHDLATVRRGHFHASEDSPNAHSYWCRKVNGITPLTFEYLTVDKQAEGASALLNEGYPLHRKSVAWLATALTGERVKRVSLVVAERQKTFPAGLEEHWTREFLNTMTDSAAKLPQIPCVFPNLEIEIVGGNEPGIQVVDFLLWAALRTWGPSPVLHCPWSDRAGIQVDSEWTQQGDPVSGRRFFVSSPVPQTDATEPPLSIPKERDSVHTSPATEMARIFCFAEANVHCLATNGLPPHSEHLAREMADLAHRLGQSNEHVSVSDVRELCGAMLRAIDTVPLYDPLDAEDRRFILGAKRVFGMVHLGQNVEWLRVARWWIEARRNIAKEAPNALGWSSEATSDENRM